MKKYLNFIFALLFWVFLWYLAALWVDKELFIPYPSSVFLRLTELVTETEFWLSLGSTFIRIFIGFISAAVAGVVFAVLTAKIIFVNVLVKPLMTVIKSTPIASFIILALVFISSERVPTFASFLMILPVIWENTFLGIRSIDPKLNEMAYIFGFSKYKRLLYLYIPQVSSYFASAGKTALGLAWKAGVAAEALCSTKLSVGDELIDAKRSLETVDVFAWTLTIIFFSLIIEKLFVALFRKMEVRID